MFDFIKGKPKEDTSTQDQSSSLGAQADSVLQAKVEELTERLARTKKALEKAEDKNEELEEELKREAEKTKEAKAQVCPSSAPQTDSALQAKVEELTARLARTKKALEKAEEENEELEDKLKRDKREAEKREAEKAKEAEEKVSAMEKQLSSLQETLDETTDQVNCRGEALSFVQEVLTAKPNSERSELEQKVEEIASFIHSDECRAYITLTDEGERDLSMWQSECAKSWIQGKVKVAFIGEFSAGKTSIVNRLLQDGDPHAIQLPVSSKATTAIPTYISGRKGGGKATYRFYTPDSILKEISEDTFPDDSFALLYHLWCGEEARGRVLYPG